MVRAWSRTRVALMLLSTVLFTRGAWAAEACPGDCNADGRVTIGEVITVVRMNLGDKPVSACPAGARNGFAADNVDVVCALRNALFSTCQTCP